MKEIIFAGFGGQGVLTSGLLIGYTAMKNGFDVLWSPAYGGQQRGGKAYSIVKINRGMIANPMMSKLDIVVAMNTPSLDFLRNLKPNGIAIANSDVVPDDVSIQAARVYRIPMNSLAASAGGVKAANIVAVGAVIRALDMFDREESVNTMCRFFEDKGKGRFNDMNIKAVTAGYEAIC